MAITKNASVITLFTAALGCMILSFFSPFVAVINSIPKCVMGGACVALYGFIAVSGLQMLKEVDLGDNKNLYVVSAILVCGIGGFALNFGTNSSGNAIISVTAIAAALIVGLITNLIVNIGKNKDGGEDELSADVAAVTDALNAEDETENQEKSEE